MKYENPDGHVAIVDDILIGIAICGTIGLLSGFAAETVHQLTTDGKIADVDAILKATAIGGVEGVIGGAMVGASAGALALSVGVEIGILDISAESIGISAYASMASILFVSMSEGAIE